MIPAVLSWILLLILLALFTVLFTWLFGKFFGRGEILPPATADEDLIGQNRELIEEGDVANLKFDIVPRGYRPEQVDAALEQLKDQLNRGSGEGDALFIQKND